LTVDFDLNWMHYSNYQFPYATANIAPGYLLAGIVVFEPQKPQISLQDVYVPRVGIEYHMNEKLTLRGGYYYEKSFIKSIDLPFYDNDKHSISAGLGLTFKDLLGVIPGISNINLSLQTILFSNRTFTFESEGESVQTGGEVFSSSVGFDVTF